MAKIVALLLGGLALWMFVQTPLFLAITPPSSGFFSSPYWGILLGFGTTYVPGMLLALVFTELIVAKKAPAQSLLQQARRLGLGRLLGSTGVLSLGFIAILTILAIASKAVLGAFKEPVVTGGFMSLTS